MEGPRIVRRIFFVPLAWNDHGKTTLLKALHNQAARRLLERPHRGRKKFTTPWGRTVDVLFSPRSYQETLKAKFKSVCGALDGIDNQWRHCELVIFPSHLDADECQEIIGLAHSAGFDCICMPVFLNDEEIKDTDNDYAECLSLNWDERWTFFNPVHDRPKRQLNALGHDLWTWLAAAITRQ